MTVSGVPAPRGRRAAAALFLRFCVVGAVGFLVDAGVLLVLVGAHLAGPVGGRLVSFAVAVVTTFELNRRWAFGRDGGGPFLPLFLRYLGVQGLGFAVNFAVYALLYALLPPPLDHPLLCLAVASGVALLVNFAGVRFAVFRGRAA